MKTLTHKLGAAVAALLLAGAAAAQSIAPPTGMPLNPVPPFDAEMEGKRQGTMDADCEITHNVRKDETDSVRYFLRLHPLVSNRPDTLDFDINCTDSRGRTALFFAAARNNAEVVELILSNEFAALNADPDLQTSDRGRTPLYIAASKGNTDAVRAFLQADTRPDLTIADNDRWTPLMAAIAGDHAEIATLLKEAGAVLPDPMKTVEYALRNDNGELLTAALDAGHANFPFGEYDRVLFKAVLTDNEDLVSALLADGATCGLDYHDGRTALQHASARGITVIVDTLKRHNCVKYTDRDWCFDNMQEYVNGDCRECEQDEQFDPERSICRLPEPCRADQVQTADGFGCECPDGQYERGDGRCVMPCLGCKAFDDGEGICKCPPTMLEDENGDCLVPASCHNGMVVSDDQRSCVCPEAEHVFQHGQCRACPHSGQIPNSDQTACVCPAGKSLRTTTTYDHRGRSSGSYTSCRAGGGGGGGNNCENNPDPSCRGNDR